MAEKRGIDTEVEQLLSICENEKTDLLTKTFVKIFQESINTARRKFLMNFSM